MKARVKAKTSHKSRANDEKAERGSGNVFADLGFRDPEELSLPETPSTVQTLKLAVSAANLAQP